MYSMRKWWWMRRSTSCAIPVIGPQSLAPTRPVRTRSVCRPGAADAVASAGTVASSVRLQHIPGMWTVARRFVRDSLPLRSIPLTKEATLIETYPLMTSRSKSSNNTKETKLIALHTMRVTHQYSQESVVLDIAYPQPNPAEPRSIVSSSPCVP